MNEVFKHTEKHPEADEVCRYAARDCKILDDITHIGRYSKHTPSLFAATGFNKWGITSSMVAADILNDLILEKENPYS